MRTAALALLLLAAAARGDTPEEIVGKLLASTDPAEKAKLADALVAAAPDPREVARWFAKGRAYGAEVPTGWLDLKVKGRDGEERPYLLHVPKGYAPGTKHPMLVDMHGGVSRPATLTHRELDQMKFFWGEFAETNGWFLAIPSGESGAEWWTPVGAGNVLAILAETRRAYDIDEDRVFATGFSDGGSGSFYLALAEPTPLAGIVALNGHVAVAQAGGLQVHLRNFRNVPVYAINTENDSLYPPASMRPIADAMKELGAKVTWREIAGYAHDPTYLPAERPAIAAWMAGMPREAHPRSVVWEGTAPGRVRWLAVTELGETGRDADFPDVNPQLPPGRPRIGVNVDQAFGGPGVKISQVQEGTPGAALGLQPGDVIAGLDTSEIRDMRDLQAALRGKKFGDAFKIRFRRGEETQEKEGKFPDARPEEALRRTAPYGSLRAEVKENVVDVQARRVRAFDLYLSEPLFDLAKPVTVRVNGETLHQGVVAPDLRFLVEQAAADADRAMVYLARLRLAVPAAPR